MILHYMRQTRYKTKNLLLNKDLVKQQVYVNKGRKFDNVFAL